MKSYNKNKAHSAKFLRQRKFLLFLPVLVMPSVTVIFYLFGGGSSNTAKAEGTVSGKGLNTSLPNANLKKDNSWNKLQYYEQADKDSVKRKELLKNDPNYKANQVNIASQNIDTSQSIKSSIRTYNSTSSAHQSNSYTDPNEAKVYAKLAELDKELNKSAQTIEKAPLVTKKDSYYLNQSSAKDNSTDISRLEKLMQMSERKEDNEDPEMAELNGMLEKIMDVQHPERVKERIQSESIKHRQQIFPISPVPDETGISLLAKESNDDTSNRKDILQNAFYSIDELELSPEENNAIPALVPETETVGSGSTVKLRLMQDMYAGGLFIAKNSFINGQAQLNGERLTISINSIRVDHSIIPVSLTVFDLDGIEGIYVPGAISTDVISNSTDEVVQSISMNTLDPSIGARAATAGIEAAKSLLSKKAKLIRVTLKAGYQVLIRGKNLQQN